MRSWHLGFDVPGGAVEVFTAVLEEQFPALMTARRDAAWRVEAIATDMPPRDMLDRLLGAAAAQAGVSLPVYEIAELEDRDWVAWAQRDVAPVRAGRFFVRGGDCIAPIPAGCLGLTIEATTAFGTGEHESTRGCLLMLDRLASTRSFARVLDMGTGSGILAIAAARLWSRRVMAVDNDPEAVRVTRRHAEANDVADQIVALCAEDYSALAALGPFDLVLSNILSGPLVALAPGLADALEPGGMVVLAGLLNSQADEVLAAHGHHGLVLRDRLELGEWSILLLAKEAGRQE